MSRTVAMMQPYLFPYLGYFQLISASDTFVLGDDLQYVKGSWMNRNRVLVSGQPKLITFPLKKGNQRDLIMQRWLSDDFEREAATLLKMLDSCYARAPQHADVMPLLREILGNPERNLARFTEHSIRRICAHMGIDTPIVNGSHLGDTQGMDKQQRVIELAHLLGAQRYINPIGGMELYCPALFRAHDLLLRFLRMDDLSYPQLKHPFVPSLSIIDVLMFNSPADVQGLLGRFSLLEGKEQLPTLQPA